MTRPFIALLLCAAPLGAAEPRVDQYGDPLPDGAIARMGTMRLRHPGASLQPPPSFSPDGRAVVTVGGDDLRVWDAATGKLRFTFGERDKRVYDARHAPDGKEIAVAREHDVLLLDAETAKVRRRWPSERAGDRERGRLFFSPDGKTLLAIESAGDRNETAAVGYDPATGAKRFTLPLPENCRQFWPLAWSAGTLRALVKSGFSGPAAVRVFDLKDGSSSEERQIELPISSPSIAISPDGKYAAARHWPGDQAPALKLYDLSTGNFGPKLVGNVAPWCSAFSPDGKTIVASCYYYPPPTQEITIWNVATGEVRRHFEVPWTGEELSLSSDGQTLLMRPAGTNIASLWDVRTGKRRFTTPTHDHWVSALTFSRDGKSLVTTSHDRFLRVWDASSGKYLREMTIESDSLQLLATEADGTLFSWDPFGCARWHDLQGGRRLAVRDTLRGVMDREALDYGNGESWYVYCPAARCVLFHECKKPQPATGEEPIRLMRCDLPGGRVTAGPVLPGITRVHAATPDSRLAIAPPPRKNRYSGVTDEEKRQPWSVLDVESGTVVFNVSSADPEEFLGSAVFTPNGQSIVAIGITPGHGDEPSRYTLHVWETRTGRLLYTSPVGPVGRTSYAKPPVVSPDSRLLVVDELDGALRFHAARDGRDLGRLNLPSRPYTTPVFRPDGKALATGHYEGMALVWDTARFVPSAGKPVADLEARWKILASDDAAKAHAAIWELIDTGAPAVEFLAAQLKPAAAPALEQVRQWLTDLEDARFERRRAAEQMLKRYVDLLRDDLRAAASASTTAEGRKRLEAILGQGFLTSDANELRSLRAVEVLEQIGTPDARRVLEALAKGAASARLTRDANLALLRAPKANP